MTLEEIIEVIETRKYDFLLSQGYSAEEIAEVEDTFKKRMPNVTKM